MSGNPYTDYYYNQAGGGVGTVYSGTVYQRGHGIGSFLGGLFRSAIPLLRKSAKSVGSELLRSSGNIARDMLIDRQPWKQSFKKRFSETTDKLNTSLKNNINSMIGNGYKKKKYRKKNHSVSSRPKVKKRKIKSKRLSHKKKLKKRTSKNKKHTLPRDIFS